MKKLTKEQFFNAFPNKGITDFVKYYYINIDNVPSGYLSAKLKDLTWYTAGSGGVICFYADLDGSTEKPLGTAVPLGDTAGYTPYDTVQDSGTVAKGADKKISWSTVRARILIKDTAYSTPATFKAHFDEDDIVYYPIYS